MVGRSRLMGADEEGRHMAATFPGARFVVPESRDHLMLDGEPAGPRFLSDVRRFSAS